MNDDRAHGRTSPDEEEAFAASRADREGTLSAVHGLEEAAGTAAPGREGDWLDDVVRELRSLEDAVAIESAGSRRPDTLLSMIARDYPRRFRSRVRGLQQQLDDIARTIASLREQLEGAAGEPPDVADLRQRLVWLTEAIRHRRARESDLVYEAIRLDLGRGPDEPSV